MKHLVLGFIPLLDCASLAVARDKGFAEDEGLLLTLVRESSWANIRDRLLVGHFDAAHMLGPMTVASTLGIGHVAVPLAAPFALGLGGNAITVSISLARQIREKLRGLPIREASAGGYAARVGEALGLVVAERARLGKEPLTFGMVYPFSCHNYELRYWLASSGIHPDRDVRLVVIPPPFLVDAMRADQIDGFCVGEPWNSVAVEAGVGSIALATTDIWRLSPEKVLGCRADWAESRGDLLEPLLRSLYRASEWCAEPANRGELARLLAEPRYLGSAARLLDRALAGVLPLDAAADTGADFHVPLAHAATFPWVSHAMWFYSQMVRWGQTTWSQAHFALARATYRPDLYRAALASFDLDLPIGDTRVEGAVLSGNSVPSTKGSLAFDGDGFFDAKVFDPADVETYTRGFDVATSS